MSTPSRKKSAPIIDNLPQSRGSLKTRNRRPIARLHRNASSSLLLHNLPAHLRVEQPCFIPSGILEKDFLRKKLLSMANDANVSYSPPSQACKPLPGFRVYTYQTGADDNIDDGDIQNSIPLEGEKSFYFMGKASDCTIKDSNLDDRAAVLQFRADSTENVRLYILDLHVATEGETTNETSRVLVNGRPIPLYEYVELLNKDTVRISPSSTDYLFMCPNA